ncbi:uncharacterized protein [Panulirus ornatus]|uniref:uncharacterized protein n=1 Tax=Panulirus ornatus TaxID=150431 RepID=UPI003A885975
MRRIVKLAELEKEASLEVSECGRPISPCRLIYVQVLKRISSLLAAKHDTIPSLAAAVDAVLAPVTNLRCSVIYVLDGSLWGSNLPESLIRLRTTEAIRIIQLAVDGKNVTHTQLSQVISDSRRLRQESWCLTVVMVSDDPSFLTVFSEAFFKGRVLAWPTRVLVVTRLPYQDLRDLHKTYSMTNAMMLIVKDRPGDIRYNVYMQLPYSSQDEQGLRVANWTPRRGLALLSSLPLYPDKFTRFLQRPTLVVASEESSINALVTNDDYRTTSNEGQLIFKGPVANLLNYASSALNFSYIYVRPSDSAWGSKKSDGSWSGMVGMMIKQEADIAAELFSVQATRAEVVDFTRPIMLVYGQIVGGRGLPEVDPWGFLLPLTPLVWASILVTLVVLPTVVVLLASCFSHKSGVGRDSWWQTTFVAVRILLQQGKVDDDTRNTLYKSVNNFYLELRQ